MATKRIAVAGSKAWPNADEPQVRTAVTNWVLANTAPGDTVHFKRGDFTTGVDTFVDAIANTFSPTRTVMKTTFATESFYGSFADQVRNRKLLDSGVDIVMVFVNSDSTSAGNLARMAEKDEIPVITTTHV